MPLLIQEQVIKKRSPTTIICYLDRFELEAPEIKTSSSASNTTNTINYEGIFASASQSISGTANASPSLSPPEFGEIA